MLLGACKGVRDYTQPFLLLSGLPLLFWEHLSDSHSALDVQHATSLFDQGL